MRKMNCIDCGKMINTGVQGPFRCEQCKGKHIKHQPKQGGISG